jgi:hypothetical protein
VEGGRDGPSGFQQGSQVGFGGLLKSQQRLPVVVAVGMAAGEESGFGNSDAVFILPQLDLGNGNNHC